MTQCIRFVRGDRIDKKLTIKREDESVYVLRENESVHIQVKSYVDGRAYITKVLDVADDEGKLTVSFLPEDTRDMHVGKYWYDARLYRNGEEVYTIIPKSPFILDDNITEVNEV